MTDARLDPPLSMPTYAVRAPLARWLAEEAARAAEDFGRYRLLDAGCGEKPYAALFAPYVSEHVGLDSAAHANADLVGPIEAIPAEDASFDLVTCIQVLEHVDDPARAIRELHRVTRQGGRVLLSTHGAMVYHPNPSDPWRWTHEGLERLFTANGDWRSVTVSPGSGTASSLAMLNAIFLEHALRRTPLRPLRGSVVSVLNRAARWLDGRSATLRGTLPGTLAGNYHVVAEKRGGTPGSPTDPLLLRSSRVEPGLASRPAKPASGRRAGGTGGTERAAERTDRIEQAA